MRYSMSERDTTSPSPPFDVHLLCENVYYYRENSYRENHFIQWDSYWRCLLFLYMLIAPPHSLLPSPFGPEYLISLPDFSLLYCNDT